MLTLFQIPRSLLLFTVAIVLAGAALGQTLTAAGIAVFLFLLAVIEGKPSWRRIFDPDRNGEGGILRYVSWKRLDPRPNDRDPTVRVRS